MIEENCYLLHDSDSKDAALIDCGAFFPEERKAISDSIEQQGLKLTHLFNTHAHFDHLFGAGYIHDRYGVGIELCEAERSTYDSVGEQVKLFLHQQLPLQLPPVVRWFHDGDRLTVGPLTLEVIATPGHTPGGICFYDEADGVLFSGDSLFRHEIGRCDLPGGSLSSLVSSLKERILALPDEVKVLPGHGDATTVGEERRSNPYLR